MYAPRKVFILENGGYTELTYEEFCRRREVDPSYEGKLFLPVQGCLIESDQENYTGFYQDKERWLYLQRLDYKNGLLSIDAFDSKNGNGTDYISATTEDADDEMSDDMLQAKLRESIFLLPDEGQLLIFRYYYLGFTETKLTEKYGISQQAISKRIKKIVAKLKILMKI